MVPIRWNRIPDVERVTIQVDVSWLVCKEDCIPGWAALSLDLPVSSSPLAGPMAARFSKARQHLPAPEPLSGRHDFTDSHVVLSFTPPSGGEWQALPLRGDVATHGAMQQLVLQNGTASQQATASREGTASLLIPRSHYLSPDDQPLRFLLTNGRQGYYLTSEANPGGPASGGHPLWLLVIMAFAGGLILNLMPCVLPVLSIKALGLQQGLRSLPHKLAYGMGVWLSFLVFAGIIIGFKAAGTGVGWGFHMQNPVVIVLLSYLFLYIALNLLDLVPSGGRLAGIGQGLTQGDSTGNQFFTGVLAVLVASPCTAPFMAAALGVAVVSDSLTTLAVFTALAWVKYKS